ncbi:per os infectivity factor pif-1 [Cotesia congregata filamentous virus 1]|uniref:Per os infectivity factor pif-1 n=1 Tax=Cotesia congregata filamentous virus 1 TaxID=3064291 RepID=A0ABC8QKP7_9VIRU|nr:per os infectivity factor pif-1 [Cotesia congregata filamentous virus 1]
MLAPFFSNPFKSALFLTMFMFYFLIFINYYLPAQRTQWQYENRNLKLNVDLSQPIRLETNQLNTCSTSKDCSSTQEQCIKNINGRILKVQSYFGHLHIVHDAGVCGQLEGIGLNTTYCEAKFGGERVLSQKNPTGTLYTWMCSCRHPWIFQKSLITEACLRMNPVGGCPGELSSNLFNSFDEIKCKCKRNYTSTKTLRNGLVMSTCRPTTYFDDKHYKPPDSIELAPLEAIDEKYLEKYISATAAPSKLPNPCRYDALTGQAVESSATAVGLRHKNNVYFCDSADPLYVTVTFNSDYLKNNDGRFPNGVVKVYLEKEKKLNLPVVYEDAAAAVKPPMIGWMYPISYLTPLIQNNLNLKLLGLETAVRPLHVLIYNAPNTLSPPAIKKVKGLNTFTHGLFLFGYINQRTRAWGGSPHGFMSNRVISVPRTGLSFGLMSKLNIDTFDASGKRYIYSLNNAEKTIFLTTEPFKRIYDKSWIVDLVEYSADEFKNKLTLNGGNNDSLFPENPMYFAPPLEDGAAPILVLNKRSVLYSGTVLYDPKNGSILYLYVNNFDLFKRFVELHVGGGGDSGGINNNNDLVKLAFVKQRDLLATSESSYVYPDTVNCEVNNFGLDINLNTPTIFYSHVLGTNTFIKDKLTRPPTHSDNNNVCTLSLSATDAGIFIFGLKK